jgi:hypothetical protein
MHKFLLNLLVEFPQSLAKLQIQLKFENQFPFDTFPGIPPSWPSLLCQPAVTPRVTENLN